MARKYESAILLTGDASGAVSAIELTDDHLRQLNARQQRNKQTTSEWSRGWDRATGVMKTAAVGAGALAAGLAALGVRQTQAVMQADNQARALTLATGQLQAMQYAAGSVGVEQDKMGDILKDVSDKIGDAYANGGAAALEVIQNLGLSTEELVQMDPAEQLLTLGSAMDRLQTQSERVTAMEALASDASLLLPLLKDNGAEFRRLSQQAYDLNIALPERDIQTYRDAYQEVYELRGATEGLFNTLISGIAQSDLSGLEQSFGNLRDTITDPQFQESVVTIASALVQMADWGAEAVSDFALLGKQIGTTTAQLNGYSNEVADLEGKLQRLESMKGGSLFSRGGLFDFGTGFQAYMSDSDIDEAIDHIQSRLRELGVQTGDAASGNLALSESAIAAANALGEQSRVTTVTATNLKPLVDAYDQYHVKMEQLQADRATLQQLIKDDPANAAEYRRMLAENTSQIDKLRDSRKSDTTASREAKEAEREHQRALEDSARTYSDLLGLLSPVGAAHAEYQSTLSKLRLEVEEGTKSELEYYAAVSQAAAVYNDAVDEADAYAQSVRDLIQQYDGAHQRGERLEQSLRDISAAYKRGDIDGQQYQRMVAGIRDEMRELALESDPAAQEMARAWEEAADRIDETFADAFAGAFDSFDDFASQLEDGFKRLLAELAYQATLRPIVIGFTSDMQRSMGMQGQSGQSLAGGFDQVTGNLGSIGSSALDYGRSLFGGGSAGASGGLYSNVATGSSGGLYGNVATSGGGGLWGGSGSNFSGMSGLASAGAGYAGSYVGGEVGSELFGKHANSNYGAMAGTAIGTYFGGPVGAFAGGALGGALDSAFGSDRVVGAGLVQDNSRGVTDFYGKEVDGESWSQRVSQYGQFGLTHKTMMEPDELADWLDAIKDYDNLLANAGNAAQKSSVRDALDGQKWKEDGSGSIGDITEERTAVIIDALKAASSDAVVKLIDNVGEITADNIDRKMPELANALRLGDLIDGLSGNVQDYALRVVDETKGNVEQTLAQLTSAIENFQIVEDAADGLGLNFNTLANNAVDAADDLVTAAGGIDAFRSQTSAYYDAFYTDAERTERQIEQLNEALKGTGLSADSSRADFRDLMDSINVNSSDGRELAATLFSVNEAFAAVVPAADEASESAEDLAKAEQRLADKRADLQIELLKAQGDEEEAQRLERKAALEATDESLRSLQRQVWAAQDQAEANEAAAEAAEKAAENQRRYADALDSSRDYLAGFSRDIGSYLDQLNASDAGLASPGDQLASAAGAFREQYDLALSGDRNALDSITQYADRYMQAQQGWSGSGGETAGVVDRIETMLAQLPEQLSPEQFLADEFSGALAGQTSDLVGALDLNGDGVTSAIEREISANLDATSALSGVLVEQMRLNGQKALTAADIRDAFGVTERRASEILSSLDRNGDGIVTATELAASETQDALIGTLRDRFDGLADVVLTVDQIDDALRGKASSSDIAALKRAADANGDGVVTATELAASRVRGGVIDSLERELDRLGGRQLTQGQVTAALSGTMSSDDARALLRSIDSNGDGVVTATELAAARTRNGLIDTLEGEFGDLGSRVLTVSQIRAELRGSASSADIDAVVRRLDVNGDGIVSATEMAAADQTSSLVSTLRDRFGDLAGRVLTADQIRTALKGTASDSQIEALIRTVDSNGDGVISLAEAQRQTTAGLPGAIASSLGPLFDSLDLDVDGFLTFDELRKGLGEYAPDDILRSIFDTLDRDGDGQISRLEALRKSTDRTGDNTGALEGLGSGTIASIDSMDNHINKMWRDIIEIKNDAHRLERNLNDRFDDRWESWLESDNRHLTKAWRESIDIRTQTKRAAGFLKKMYETDWIDGSHYTGLANVPYDGYIAELHKDEAVLTAEENQLWQSLRESGPRTLQPLVMPPPAMPASSGQGSVEQLLRDNNRLMQQNLDLTRQLERHGAAGVRASSEGARQQIAATERGNRHLERMEAEARLEKTKQ